MLTLNAVNGLENGQIVIWLTNKQKKTKNRKKNNMMTTGKKNTHTRQQQQHRKSYWKLEKGKEKKHKNS